MSRRLRGRAAFALALLGACGCGPAAAQPYAHTPPTAPTTLDTAIAEASLRFGIPAAWLHAVIRAESGGDARAVSRAGAIGLMQLMPATYAELRARHALGPDPFAIRDNILAGAAYLRELYDRYGARGMLAGYNAGPARWEAHLRTGRPLPAETVAYLARLAPLVGDAATPPPRGHAPFPPAAVAAPIFVARAAPSSAIAVPDQRSERADATLFVDRSAAAGPPGSLTFPAPRAPAALQPTAPFGPLFVAPASSHSGQ